MTLAETATVRRYSTKKRTKTAEKREKNRPQSQQILVPETIQDMPKNTRRLPGRCDLCGAKTSRPWYCHAHSWMAS